MSEMGSSDWAVTIFVLVALAFYCFFLGDHLVQFTERLDFGKKRHLYRKWGVEGDILQPDSRAGFTALTIMFSLGAAIMISLALLIDSTEAVLTAENLDNRTITALVALYAFVLGLTMRNQRVINIRSKIKRLEGLGEAFHQRFGRSDLLATYESLRFAPAIFWDEYANLPHDQITETTNQKYRDMAASFRHTETIGHNRVLMVVASLMLVLTAALLLAEIL